jgi:hypothetical protein
MRKLEGEEGMGGVSTICHRRALFGKQDALQNHIETIL